MAFVAVTVKVEELPELTEAGPALMLTVGAGELSEADGKPLEPGPTLVPHPVNPRRIADINAIADGKEIRRRDRLARAFIVVFLLIVKLKRAVLTRWSSSTRHKAAKGLRLRSLTYLGGYHYYTVRFLMLRGYP